jgi:hypothetical protein
MYGAWRKSVVKNIFRPWLSCLLIAWMCIGCEGTQEPVNTSDASDTSDAADASDASDTSDAADASDASDTSDAADASDASDTSDDEPMPGFTLVDENEISNTYQQAISLSDYEGEVSVWYFLHCT